MGEFDTLFETLKQLMSQGFERIEKKIDKMDSDAIENGNKIVKLETQVEEIKRDLDNNFVQHKEDFYPVKSFMDNLKGKFMIIGIIWIFLQAIIIMYIRYLL